MILFCTKEVIYILKESKKLAKFFNSPIVEPIHVIVILLLYNNITLNLLNFNLTKNILINILVKKNYYLNNNFNLFSKKNNPIFSIKILKIFLNNLSNRFFCSIDLFLNLLNIEKKLLNNINNDIIFVNNLNKKTILKKIGIKFLNLKTNLVNRNKLIIKLHETLNKNLNPLLIGEKGVGKKTIVNLYYNNYFKNQNKFFEIWFIDLNKFFYEINTKKKFNSFLNELKYNKILLVFENIHLILKLKKKNLDIYNLFINNLYFNKFQIIGIVVKNKYNLFIKNNNTLNKIFNVIEIKEPNNKKLLKILNNHLLNLEINNNIFISNNNLKEVINISKNYLKNEYFPKKAIDLIDIINDKILNVNKNILEKNKIKYINNNLIKYILSDKINIPTKIMSKKNIDFNELELNLKNFIIGQNLIVNKIINYIKKNNLGIKYKNKPVGSWFFCGPSGTGKTELSKYLSNFIFGFKNKLIKFDMSEYMEKHSISRLIGSPPGYIGYEEGGQLTQTVLKNPYSVILFDEIEKAHSEITNIMLQILDEGVLTDSSGKKIDFSNTYIIFTSNLGCPKNPNDFNSFKKGISFTKKEYELLSYKINNAIKEYFKPEFINRLNDIFIFKPLSINNLSNILDKFINQLIYKIKKINKNIYIIINNNVKILLAKLSYNPLYGARPLKKNIENFIEKPLTNIFLNIKINKPHTLTFFLDKKNKSIKYLLKKY